MLKIIKKTSLMLLTLSVFLSSCRGSNNLTLSKDSTFALSDTPTAPTVPSFQWGVSTAGFQSEGYDTGSIWHSWDLAGKTLDHNPKGVDFLNRYKEDIQLAKDMGCNAFRFSIEWDRIEPKKGVFDPAGIAFYRSILNTLKEKGMTPLVTLVHFNYPQWVVNDSISKKGLEDPAFIDHYLSYVEHVVKEFKDDIKFWLTFNEPNIWVPGAYLFGETPPGRRNPISTIRASWNLLKAHSMAYDLIHGIEPEAMVSSNVFYLLPKPFGPVTDPNGKMKVQLTDKNLDTDWFFESIDNGRTTIDTPKENDPNSVGIQSVEGETLAQQVNRESKTKVKIKPQVNNQTQADGTVNATMDSQVSWLKKFDYVAFDYYYRFRNFNQAINIKKPWLMEIYPEGLYDAIMTYSKKYNKPVLIAENGIATEDNKPRADRWTRESAIVQHIRQVKKAMADGANVIGYFHWSITDNYEWGTYTPRFGLYTVNALTDPEMKRIPTPAVDVYKEIIKNNGVTTDLLNKYKNPNEQL